MLLTGSKTYHIHDNGGRPFKVCVNYDAKTLQIHTWTEIDYDGNKPIVYDKMVMTLKFDKIFIGNSAKTEFTKDSGGYGRRFNGNSILVKLKPDTLDYVYIGSEIFQFKAKSEIIAYFSPVGNNDVPYPYAVDIKEGHYLMLEMVYLSPAVIEKYMNDEYDYIGGIYWLHYYVLDKKGLSKRFRTKILQKRK